MYGFNAIILSIGAVFEQKKKSHWNWSWAGIIVVVGVVLALIQIFRVNPPTPTVLPNESAKTIWTNGTIVKGVVEIPANGFLSFPLNLNRRIKFKGSFRTGDSDKRLELLILPGDDFEKWKTGGSFKPLVQTGFVPRGKVDRVIEAGNYFLLLDNRLNSEARRLIESDFFVE